MNRSQLKKILIKICKKDRAVASSKKAVADKSVSKIKGVDPKFANILRNYTRRSGIVVNQNVDLSSADAWLEPDIFIVPEGSTKEKVIMDGKKALLKAIAGYLSGIVSNALNSSLLENDVLIEVPAQGRAYKLGDTDVSDDLTGRRRIHVKLGEPHGTVLIGTADFIPNLRAKGGEGVVSLDILGVPKLTLKFSDFGDIQHGWSVSTAQEKKMLEAIQKGVDNYLKKHKEIAVPLLDY